MATGFGFEAFDIEKSNEPFVFISYKSEDNPSVSVYARYLHDHGINVWYDDGLHAGSDWESYLMQVIERENCRAVLLFVSAKVAASTVIPLETTQARKCKKPTVAVYLESGLDLEVLLNKAIKVYVEQRQSVYAYSGDVEKVCEQVLEAATMAMENTAVTMSDHSYEEQLKTAQFFIMNARRSRSKDDVDRARKLLLPLTEQKPTDFRGWLGLALCAVLTRPESIEGAAEQLKAGAKYYSYVVSAGADSIASDDYTSAKTSLWRDILYMLRVSVANASDAVTATALRDKAGTMGSFFGHTERSVELEYKELMSELDEKIPLLEVLDEKAAHEKRIAEFAARCEWRELAGGSLELAGVPEGSTDIVIPAQYNGRTVVSIGSDAMLDHSELVSVTIPDTVRTISAGAFMNCSSLRSVIIPDGVTSLGGFCFSGCSSLAEVSLPAGLEAIGEGAFEYCTCLTAITLPAGIKRIGRYAFRGCTALASTGLPERQPGAKMPEKKNYRKLWLIPAILLVPVVLIGLLTSVVGIVNTGGSIDILATVILTLLLFIAPLALDILFFRLALKKDKSDELPSAVAVDAPAVCERAFMNCSSLRRFDIPDGMVGLGDSAFAGCTALEIVTFPESVTAIGKDAFSGCTKVTIVAGKNSCVERYARKYNLNSL